MKPILVYKQSLSSSFSIYPSLPLSIPYLLSLPLSLSLSLSLPLSFSLSVSCMLQVNPDDLGAALTSDVQYFKGKRAPLSLALWCRQPAGTMKPVIL